MKERIEKILTDKKLTQAEFADYIGVNRSSITHIMTGRNKSSDTVVASTLLAFPDINPQWLSEGKGEMYKPFTEKRISSEQIQPINVINEFEQGNLFNNTDMYVAENKQQNSEIPQKTSSPEWNIQPPPNDSPPISPLLQDEKKENKTPILVTEKQIRKIVFFYTDKTFEEYYPEKN